MAMEYRLALTALISAYQQVDDGDGLKALLPVAGHVLIEHQARQAAQAGARTVIVLVERVPTLLLGAIDRLRREGLRVEVARSIADAADRVHPEEHLLVIGDGLIADQEMLDRIAACGPQTIVTVPDDRDHVRHERIDGTTRWGGLMLIDGGQLRGTAAMLGDWDPQSTLLRRLVQLQAMRLPADVEADGLFLIDRAAALDAVRDRLLSETRDRRGASWVGRSLYPLIEDLAVPPLLDRSADPQWFHAAGMGAMLLAALGFVLEWPALGLGLALAGGLLDAIARRMARMRLQPPSARRLYRWGMRGAEALALGTAAWWLMAIGGGWGAGLCALMIVATMAALAAETGQLPKRTALPAWIADIDALMWTALPFALLSAWLIALIAMLAYALASFAYVQSRVSGDRGGTV
jgi:hypothetical protein